MPQKRAFADERTPRRSVSSEIHKTFATQILNSAETKNIWRCNPLFDFRLKIEFLWNLIQKWTMQRHSNLTFSGGKAFEFKFSTFSPQ